MNQKEMKPDERAEAVRVLSGVITAFKKYDAEEIMALSDTIIHTASITQQQHVLQLAMVIYSIGKIIARGKIRRYPQDKWNTFVTITRNELDCTLTAINTNNFKAYSKCLLNIQQVIMTLDESFMSYVDHVINQAKLTKGTKIYEHGVSLKIVAELFGVTEWELMDYAGKTRMLDRDSEPSDVPGRLDKARRFFNERTTN